MTLKRGLLRPHVQLRDCSLIALLVTKTTVTLQELAKLLEDQHGYIDLQNIPENKYYSMDKNPDEDEKLWGHWSQTRWCLNRFCDNLSTLIKWTICYVLLNIFFQNRVKYRSETLVYYKSLSVIVIIFTQWPMMVEYFWQFNLLR